MRSYVDHLLASNAMWQVYKTVKARFKTVKIRLWIYKTVKARVGTYKTVKVRTRHIQDSQGQNSAHIRQSRPDSGLGFRVNFLKTFQDVPSSLGSGTTNRSRSSDVQTLIVARGSKPDCVWRLEP